MVVKRALGSSGLDVAPLVLGGNVFGWTADQPTSFAVLDAFVAGGGTMIDTADVYSQWIPGNSGGESETVIGHWLKQRGRRDDVQIATKVGMLVPEGLEENGLSPRNIAVAVEASLRRLQTDYIDLYFAHRDDADTPFEETLAAFDGLIKAGKVRAIAASNYTADRLAEALAVSDANGLARYTALQPWYNLLDRKDFEGPLQQLCIAENIGVVPYFGLASGFLTGKYRNPADAEGKARGYRVKDYVNDRGFAVLAAMDAIAGETGASLPQIALAWIAAQPGLTAPIASATSVAQVEELLGAMSLALSPDQVARLDAAGAE
ncbi:MAG: NADP-dependent aryl-alcohol dehydrogenase [Sphingomonas bacterium]|jgi:aryl-alcohol dehydrogenase-like predicted oxidoreductase|nr:NADP-dependent aryl-alcohol dehydrogenase [Sphingomonas bacterium]MDB5718617.1 NADP-dependent aryl-alcohol dehydrogenase [Sphingomonas bacterium]